MSNRLIGFGLMAMAVLVYLGLALPARRAAADTGDGYRLAREQRRDAQRRLAHAESLRQARARAASALAGSAPSRAVSLVEFRRSVLASLAGRPVSRVTLRVEPGRPPISARVTLSAEGTFGDVLALAGGLARPGSGLILDQVRIEPRGAEAGLHIEALRLGQRP